MTTVDWIVLIAVVWLLVAAVLGTIIGRGIALGDPDRQ